jgi:hypothetical protein
MSGLLLWALTACNPDPGEAPQGVGYRNGDDGTNSGERGTIKISEVLWSGSVTNDGVWDPDDVFLEIRNEGARPVRLTDWFVDLDGPARTSWRIPEMPEQVQVGEHFFIAAKTTGCFPDADLVIPGLTMGQGDDFELVLRDADERLIEPAGDPTMPPFAGIYDGQVSRSMEKIELIFGGRGNEPQAWHHYTIAEVDVPNNTRVAEGCRQRTLASPGHPNSPDYSGAFAAGGLD